MFTSFTRRHFLLASVTTLTVALFIWQSQSVDSKQTNTVNTTVKAFTQSTSTEPKSEFTPAALKDKLSAKNKLQKVKLPLHFEANQGQFPKGVEFASRTKEFQLFLQGTQVRILLPIKAEQNKNKDQPLTNFADRKDRENKKPSKISYAEVRMQPIGANQNSTWRGDDKQVGISSYFSGNDPKQWQTKVPHYGSVRYDNLYKGIDLKYYGNPQQLEYDFIVKPGVDPSVIKLGFEGVDSINIDKKGDAQLSVQGKTLTQYAPIAYQLIEGKKQKIEASYTLLNKIQLTQQTKQKGNKPLQLGIQLASYNPDYELVIDPVLSYSTYLGGSGTDVAKDITIDATGSMYITGQTLSTFFPIGSNQGESNQGTNALDGFVGSNFDVFISKLSPSGDQLLWTVFLIGGSHDYGRGIAVNTTGQVHVSGTTSSSNFPTLNAYDSTLNGTTDAFISKIRADGSGLIYSGFLGGDNLENGASIAVDSSGDSYITGNTNSINFPVIGIGSLAGNDDAFVTKLDPSGGLIYSNYLGGTNVDRGSGIAVDSSGQAYVTGYTRSSDFPVMSTAFDTTIEASGTEAFVVKINAAGTKMAYSSFLGGGDYDTAEDIAIDSSGQAYVAGHTQSSDFPTAGVSTTNSGYIDIFVSKVNTNGTALIYSRYLGGSSADYNTAIAISNDGQAYVTGYTQSSDFFVFNAFQATSGGSTDAYITKLNPDGTIDYSSYLGGNSVDRGNAVAVDNIGQAYIAGEVLSTNFPTVNAFDSSHNGNSDVFIAKVISGNSQLPSLTSPSGYTTESPVNFRWTHVSDPTWYKLEVTNDDGTVTHHSTWYKTADICSAGECSKELSGLPNGHNQWRVRGWKNGGNFVWTQYKPFQLAATAPTQPTLVSPLDTGSTLPTYTWNAVAGANWYYLYVTDTANGSGRIKKWYSAATAGCDASATCSITPTTTVGGAVNWWIRAWNSAGYSPWSSGMTFYTAVPGAATLVSPVGTGSGNPTYTWNAVSDSTYYRLHVNDSTGGGVINQWYSSTTVNCIPNGLCSITPATTVTGSVRWWLQTYNKAGEGAWTSPSMDFTAP